MEGFSPELALVTKGGGKDLEEPLVSPPSPGKDTSHPASAHHPPPLMSIPASRLRPHPCRWSARRPRRS